MTARALRLRRADGGFTLVEVLISVLLTAIAIVGLIGLFGVQSRSAGTSRRETEATVLAQDKLEELRALGATALVVGPTQTETVDDMGKVVPGGRYTRSWTITQTTIGTAITHHIQVQVAWTVDGVTRSVTVRAQRGET